MIFSIARLHGEACLICGATSGVLLPAGLLQMIETDGARHPWLFVARPSRKLKEIRISGVVVDIADTSRKLRLIIELCRELTKLGLRITMSDARPAVVVYVDSINLPVEITIGASGEFFEWRNGEDRHPISDPVSAALIIRESVRTWNAKPGSAS